MEVTDDLRSKLASARTHNMDSEEVMGMFSAGQARAPRATLLFISSKIRARKNNTLKFILSHPESALVTAYSGTSVVWKISGRVVDPRNCRSVQYPLSRK